MAIRGGCNKELPDLQHGPHFISLTFGVPADEGPSKDAGA